MSTPISINCSGARAGIPEAVVTVTNVCVFFCPTTIYTHACMYTILHTVLEHDALGAESIRILFHGSNQINDRGADAVIISR